MSDKLCFETICVENRTLKNLPFHEARLNRTRRELWGYAGEWPLSELIEIPDSIDNEIHKCRLSFGKEIEEIRWEPYTMRTIRKIRRVYHDDIDYSYKYEGREELNALFAQRDDADEILIIRNGLVTDSSYCNVAFFDGSSWVTPSTPLLQGTQRALLLQTGMIHEAAVQEIDLIGFSHIKLFNAMMDWERAPMLETSAIV
ncbi:aminotransferase class IV family protein [Dyadobacter sp. MSC1_007]|jgi:4-amino-4-deoxychorismate lyase|uniref:aminotransferase class IV family protein n=1 Tax=Dyadobacter sp. MSC1_007 TaxID=2909264 RepID=UPI0020307CE1|nr:aminotransferase class IV family protein [Dyadobacter sp. MSC1_007]